MSNHQYPIKKYPLLPYSQLVHDSTRWIPGVYSFSVTFEWDGGANERIPIENAICQAISNHPVFSMKTDWRTRHYSMPLKDVLHGRYHEVNIYVKGDDLFVEVKFDRILGDGTSVAVIFEDVVSAYYKRPLKLDDYWGYLDYVEQQKQTDHYRISRDWLINEFADTSIPVRPNIDRHLCILLPPKVGMFVSDYTDLHKKIILLAETKSLSTDGFFSLCTALAIAEYCGTDAAALTWAYEGRERPEEHRIFGSLHRDVPFQIRKSRIENRESAIREARNQIRSGIAHSDYPYTLTKPYTKRWNYAVNVLRVPEIKDYMSLEGYF